MQRRLPRAPHALDHGRKRIELRPQQSHHEIVVVLVEAVAGQTDVVGVVGRAEGDREDINRAIEVARAVPIPGPLEPRISEGRRSGRRVPAGGPPMAVKPIPDGYHAVTPYLIINGAARALEFYKRAFGAVELLRRHVLTGFPWCLLGYSQSAVLPLVQIFTSAFLASSNER